jgi:uncharacterized membrane protein (UPF0127 family)
MSRFRIDRTCSRVVTVTAGGAVVVQRCSVADGWVGRFVGLLATPDLGPEEGLWLAPCASVHTWGMRIPLAVAFLDRDGRVRRIVDPLPPWRFAASRGAAAVLEAPAGAFADLFVGQLLQQVPMSAG